MPSDSTPPHADDRSQRLQRLGDAMAALLQLQQAAPEDRARFLEQNQDLRDLLEPLLAPTAGGDDDGEDGGATLPGAAKALGAGCTVDDYRIVRELGRGGMGTVYEAEQLSLRRRVALKVLHEHLAWSPHAIERFRREAGAASRLKHPGLVPIHEVGEWRGRHWFSMEFVDGVPLNERMHEARLGVRSDVGRAAEAAELVARIADALQHAHEQGLVHRDVKPHNVMVCPDGSVRLLDFGLAAGAEGATDQSATGSFLGTPHYCSPEQIVGQRVGPASDVFALGILLYELIAQRRPFTAESTRGVLLAIETGRFAPLRSAAAGVPRDLEIICHKALEPVASERYRDAGALAADLRRFLRIEPILAAPPGRWTRATKWVRRHRVRVALVATTALLVIGAPTALALHLRDKGVVVRTEGMLEKTDEIGYQTIEHSLALLSDQIDRQPSPGARHAPRAHELARLCESLLAVRAEEPARRARMAQALYQVAGIHVHLGNVDDALAACARSRQVLLGGPVHDAAADAVQRQLGMICRREMLARQQADPLGGDAEFAQACVHLRPLVERADTTPVDTCELGETLLARGRNLADRLDRRIEAERMLREAIAVLRAPAVREHERAVRLAARAEGVLGHVLLDLHRTQEALTLLEELVARPPAGNDDPLLGFDRAVAQTALGEALMRLKRTADAERALRAAIATAEASLVDWPGSAMLRRHMLSCRVSLASQLMVQGRLDDAEDLLRAADAAAPQLPADGRHQLPWRDRSLRADLAGQLANCLLLHPEVAPADLAHARELLHEAIDLQSRLVADHPSQLDFRVDLAAACNSLAAAANEYGDAAAAIPLAERAIAEQREVLARAPEHRRAQRMLGIHHAQLAWALVRTGAFAAAGDAAAATVANTSREVAALRMAAEAATRAAAGLRDAAGASAPPGAAGNGAGASGDAPAVAPASGDAATPDAAAERAAATAVAALRAIAGANRKEGLRLIRDARFASLRPRADFAALRQHLERP